MSEIINLINLVVELAKKFENCGEDFKRRAEEFPTLMTQVGLAPALTFFLSKSDVEKVASLYNNISGQIDCKDTDGYSSYTAALIYLINKVENLCEIKEGDKNLIINSIIDCVKKVSQREETGMLPKKLIPYVVELKKVVNIIIPEQS
ncbi:type III-B CRISPR module-associated protein Cmr5 [Acidianus sulfidivorans JP7]|uniref:CRISPR type III-B/RAMP module-associated protein Cmr5 n=1 Tax=Acidianus sulfidivorans JP7 TaxID=619593 RepID=A0A2U9IQ22_9CREN|nr:type III-B CRISPR module-associated protein Cmr5 [Acidianus sulfidivorans]AWR98121.1 type III-B CRISPR module-associated protein Cmr5 [Acidianus sulfidivorans JP7]